VHSSPSFSALVFPRVIIAVLKEVRCTICRKVRTQHRTTIIAFLLFDVFDLTEVSQPCILYQLI